MIDKKNKEEDPSLNQIEEKIQKPPKPEDKPFESFINEDFIPSLNKALSNQGFPAKELILIQDLKNWIKYIQSHHY